MTNPSTTPSIETSQSFTVPFQTLISRACGLFSAPARASKFLNSVFEPSTALLALALGLLAWAVVNGSPAGVGWHFFLEESAPLITKLKFLVGIYVVPAGLAFVGIVLFQLQFRLSMSGAGIRTVFSVCVIGSLAMLASLRTLAFIPNSSPAYVVGMALGYTMMGRVYAIQMRTLWNRIPMPWIVWRGDVSSVRELERAMHQRMPRPVSQPQAARDVQESSAA